VNVALWIVQGLLAAVFAFSGWQKSTKSKEQLIAAGQTGVAPFPLPVVRFTAATELAAAAGLILPWATGIAPILTPLAACGLAIVMIGAMWSHLTLHEFNTAALTTVMFGLCIYVAVGRFSDL
jgi:uncharacterized membrane protein YphA (DoxX/SURF4 family)